ncbi:MAG TPA: SpoIIE family protein phosphatase [Vicinamibacteria bacterium]
MLTPVVYQYQQALDAFRREGREGVLLKRMSELISLLDLTATLGSDMAGAEILEAALLIVMGELQASRGALYVREADGSYLPRAVRGARGIGPLRPEGAMPAVPVRKGEAGFQAPPGDAGFEVLCPIRRGTREVAIAFLGPRASGQGSADEEMAFLRSVAACAAVPIENGLVYAELRNVNQKLSRKVFEMGNLFDLSRELTGSFDADSIRGLFVGTVMGHLVVSRAALYLGGPSSLRFVHGRGARDQGPAFAESEAREALHALSVSQAVSALPAGPLRERLAQARLVWVFPLSVGARLEGFLAVGDRATGAAFREEDDDFVRTLGRQALSALDNVALHQVAVLKERQDREMQIAREIQQSLFPRECPKVGGFSLAAASQPCYQVGGDHYDFIALEDGRLALAIADVSGKGAPASILMASVHAYLRALAGAQPPATLMARLNRFLLDSTQDNRYVTLFYGELDPRSRRLRYVTCGHVPPYLLRRTGELHRLEAGGPVVGLLAEAVFEEGEAVLEPGDTLVLVTDGATEALSPDDRELGDAGVCAALRTAAGGSAQTHLDALLRAVHAWTGPVGCSDDLTALILRAEET